LAAAGWSAHVTRLPDPDQPDLLAIITVTGPEPVTETSTRLAEAIFVRHTDRRPVSESPQSDAHLNAIAAAARAQADLHILTQRQVPDLAAAVQLFGAADDPVSWLRSGEALSAAWLTATTLGVSVVPLSDLVEVTYTRQTLRRLIAGLGCPHLVLRLGIADTEPTGYVPTPRLATTPVDAFADRPA
jgi:hypothetical protein